MENPLENIQRTPDSDRIGSGLEKKEALSLPSVYITYRDNDLYSTLVPKIIEYMKKIGRKVIVHSFPQGTPEDEIKKYFEGEVARNSVKDMELFADNTCKSQIDYKFKSENFKKENNLDSFSTKVMGNSLIGKEIFEKKDSEVKYSLEIEALQKVIKKVIAENGEPENLYIVEFELGNHNFNNRLFYNKLTVLDELVGDDWTDKDIESNKLLSLDSEDFIKVLESSQNFSEAVNFGFNKEELTELTKSILTGEKKNITAIWNTFIASKIKDSLRGIIDEEKIKIVPEPSKIKKGANNYVLIDRHAEALNPCFDSKIKLPLPFSSMIDDIIKNKLLDIDFDMDKAAEIEVSKIFNRSES